MTGGTGTISVFIQKGIADSDIKENSQELAFNLSAVCPNEDCNDQTVKYKVPDNVRFFFFNVTRTPKDL